MGFFVFKADYTSARRQIKYNDRKAVFKGSSSIFTLLINTVFSLWRQKALSVWTLSAPVTKMETAIRKILLNRLS